MSGFSELLTEYVGRGVYSKRQVAEMCGIDRTMLQKILSGGRKPKNEDFVIKIGSKLAISAEELKRLLEEYHILDVGTDTYYQRKEVEGFIKDFYKGIKNPPRSEKFKIAPYDDNDDEISCKCGKYNIANRLYNLLARELNDDGGDILLYIQPDYSDIIAALLNVCGENTRMRHIICLGNGSERDTLRQNMSIFHKILPFVLTDSEYNVRYYYENVLSHRNSMQLFTNYIIVNRTVIMFDYNEDNAIFIKNEDVYNMVHNSFENIWRNSEVLINYNDDATAYVKNIFRPGSLQHRMLEYGPDIRLELIDGICKDILANDIPERETYIDTLLQDIAKFRTSIEEDEKPVKVYFTRAGLRRFVESGRVDNMPVKLKNNNISQEIRFKLLEQLIDDMDNNIQSIYIVNDDVFGVTDKEMLELDSNGHLIMTRSSQSGGMQFMDVSEQGLINAFHDFFENLETDSRVTMGDSAKMYIQDIINEYNSKLSSGGGYSLVKEPEEWQDAQHSQRPAAENNIENNIRPA